MIPKRIYHGTVSTWLPDILRYGLKYTPANAWQMHMLGTDYIPAESDTPGYIYLGDLNKAKEYAWLKARYLQTEPCLPVKNALFAFPLVKLCNAPVIKGAKPVILSIPIDVIDRMLIEQDPGDFNAVRYKGQIDPKDIKVLHLT